jgi:hypothetical protein
MNGWYIGLGGRRYDIESYHIISLTNKNIIELFIPNGVIDVYCGRNNLTKLVIPYGVREVYCSDNLLTELIVPESVKKLYCSDNQLTELIVPDDCYVVCDNTVKLINKTMYNRSKRLKTILK